MVKLTFAEIKKQISALEAKAARLAHDERKASVAKVRALMDSLGVTIEHLGSTISKRGQSAKNSLVGNKSNSAKRPGAGVVRYRDPETGATWTGFGRAPGWIASAKNREAFLVGKTASTATAVTVEASPKRAAKKAPATAAVRQATKSAKRRKSAQPTQANKRPAAKKAATSTAKSLRDTAPAKKAATHKVTAKKASAPAEVPAPASAEAKTDN